jgi:hypothetical protein
VASETAQKVILGNAELRVFAKFLAQMLRRAVEEMRRPPGEVLGIDPARTDQGPIEMMLDHPLERPGLGALLQIERGVEIETVFAFDMRANEGGIGDGFGIVVDVGQLPLGRGRRHRLCLAIGKPRHLQLDLGLGHKGADFRQAEACAKAMKDDHRSAPDFPNRRLRLATPCCHRGVSSGDIVVQKSRP